MFGPMGGPPVFMRDSENKNNSNRPKKVREFIPYVVKSLKETLKRLLYIYKLVWEARPWILLLMAFMAVFNGIQPLISAYIAKLLLDNLAMAATGTLKNFWDLGGLLILQIGYQLFIHVIMSVSNMVTRMSSELLVNSIKLKIMNKAKTIDLTYFDMPDFYSKLENANREVGSRPIQVLQSSFSIISILISFLGFIAILGSILPFAPLIIVIMSLPMAVVTYKYRRKMFSYMRRRSKDRRQMDYYSNLLVDKDLVKEVKLFDLSDTFIGKYIEIFKTYFNGIKTLIVKEGIWGIIISAVNSTVNGGIFLMIAKRVFDGILTVGDYSLHTNALFSISSSVSSLVSTSASIYEGTLFIDNMIEFMSVEPKIVSILQVPRKIEKHKSHTIEFSHVSFAYPGTDKLVLKDINLTLCQGDTAVLVGLNGAGKTTLLKLLTRLYDPTEGIIYLDGYDLREYDVKELYGIFGIIFQDFGKYAFTVKENIGFGEKDRINDNESIRQAAKKSNAEQFINNLSMGYDTPLMRVFEQSGLELSIGQWQKIAVARAFFRNSDIIILDEPTASLDPMAEQEIFSQFDSLRKDKMTIFVSHRLSSATVATKIICIENGEIAECGTHRELMDLNGKYAELFNTQAKKYIDNSTENTASQKIHNNKTMK